MVNQEISMVERVAKVICCGPDIDGYCAGVVDCVVMEDDGPLIARAVIKAMREPTQAMICAVLDAHDRASPRTTRVIDDWQTMIDEALK